MLSGVRWSDVDGSQLLRARTGDGSQCPCLLVEPVVRLSIPSLWMLYRHKDKATQCVFVVCPGSPPSALHRSQEIGMLVRTSNAEPVFVYFSPLRYPCPLQGYYPAVASRPAHRSRKRLRQGRTTSGRTGHLRIPSICTAYHGNIMWVAPVVMARDARGPGNYCCVPAGMNAYPRHY